MNSFERLLEHTDTQHIRVLEKQFKSNAKGLIKGNKIAIRQDIPTVERASVLAEELGHYYTTVGNILTRRMRATASRSTKPAPGPITG